ncbi:MAG: DUF192 domain-containing protein [bacterium]
MKNFKKYSSFIVVILFSIVLGLFLSNANEPEKNISTNNVKYVKIAGAIVKVDLALDIKDQGKGLSGRNSLLSDEGMLFIFSKPDKNYFWMKEMNFPIDMVWIGDDFKVIYIKNNAQPSSYPESFGPDVDSRYVLEISAGFSEKNNLKVGDFVEFLD